MRSGFPAAGRGCRIGTPVPCFGDAGVTWRLSKRLRDLGLPVTLVIDAVDVLARLVHDLDPAATDALVRGIRIAEITTRRVPWQPASMRPPEGSPRMATSALSQSGSSRSMRPRPLALDSI